MGAGEGESDRGLVFAVGSCSGQGPGARSAWVGFHFVCLAHLCTFVRS